MWLGFVAAGICLKGKEFFLFSFFSFESYTNLPIRVKTLEVWGALEAAEVLDVGKACKA